MLNEREHRWRTRLRTRRTGRWMIRRKTGRRTTRKEWMIRSQPVNSPFWGRKNSVGNTPLQKNSYFPIWSKFARHPSKSCRNRVKPSGRQFPTTSGSHSSASSPLGRQLLFKIRLLSSILPCFPPKLATFWSQKKERQETSTGTSHEGIRLS